MNIKPSNKKIKCDGPCPYEPLTYPSGTLSDGTTYTFSISAGGTVVDLGAGTIEFGSNDPTLTVTFSNNVDLRFTNGVNNSTRTVWHGTATRYTRAETNGSAWCYSPGSVVLPLNVNGMVADSQSQSGTNANSDWGELETFAATVVDIRAYVWDAYNFEARPSEVKCEVPICEVTDDLCKKVKSLQNTPAGMPETLTSLTVNAANDELTYTDENGTANAIPLNHLEQEICEGPFIDGTNRSGWIGPAGTIHTTNSGTQTLFTWRRIGGSGAITSPDCVTDMIVNVDFGHVYYYLRRMRAYFWADVRLMVNGAAVITQTSDQYLYDDHRDETPVSGTSPLRLNMDEIGNSEIYRLNVPANATIEVQAQIRYNFSGAQTSAYGRLIRYGLRSKITATFLPRNIVTGSI